MVGDEMLDVNTDSLEWKVIRPLRFVREISRRFLGGQVPSKEELNEAEPSHQVSENMVAFAANVARIM